MTDPQKITFGEMREIGVSEPTQQAAYGLLSRLFDQIIFPDQPGGLSAIGFHAPQELHRAAVRSFVPMLSFLEATSCWITRLFEAQNIICHIRNLGPT